MRWFRITRFIRSTRLTAGLQYTDSTRCVRRFIPYFFTARLALGATPAREQETQHTQYTRLPSRCSHASTPVAVVKLARFQSHSSRVSKKEY